MLFRSVSSLLIADFEGNGTYENILKLAAAKDVNIIRLRRGMEIHDGRTEFMCLHPFDGKEYESTNEGSAVMLLKHDGFSALFTGDISSAEELELLDDGLEGVHANLLDVAHHGSRYSSCSRFIESLSPDYAAISAGVSNSYGHPHKETIARLNAQETQIFCTKELGQIWFVIDDDNKADIGWQVGLQD